MAEEQKQQRVVPDRSENPEELNLMALALEEIQLSLEPVRDQALDRKAFFTGYAQCAEEMLKAIVAKMTFLKKQAEKKNAQIKDVETEQKLNKNKKKIKTDDIGG